MNTILTALCLALAAAAPAAAADTILVVGDSHTDGPFGEALDGALRAVKMNAVATYGVCAARPQSYLSETPHHCGHLFRDFNKNEPAKWVGKRLYKEKRGQKTVRMIKTPALSQLLSDHSPTAVVVALGSNLPISDSSVQDTLDLIHKAGAVCLWVGPPDMREPTRAEIKDVYKTLAANKVDDTVTIAAAKKDSCFLIDSRGYTHYPAKRGGGTHYDGSLAAEGAQWGEDVAAAVLAKLKP